MASLGLVMCLLLNLMHTWVHCSHGAAVSYMDLLIANAIYVCVCFLKKRFVLLSASVTR